MKRPGVTFPDRREGLVHVRGVLQLDAGPAQIEITFRREEFAAQRAIDWTQECQEFYGPDAVLDPPPDAVLEPLWVLLTSIQACLIMAPWRRLPERHGRDRLVIHRKTDDGLPYTIYATRDDLQRCADDAGLPRELRILLTDTTLLRGLQGAPRPRGRHAMAPGMLAAVRWALLEAEQLCTLAVADSTVRARLVQKLGADFTPDAWRENAITLVNRSFAGAWARHHVTPLDARPVGDAGDVYRVLLPSAYRRDVLADFHAVNPPARRAWIHAQWEHRLLGPDGQAARDFDLI